ncbi:hypothetical protein RFI_15716 [Reticulomyxa filosa]|uniref:Uncharacterized protein n=1 Tax=Reticulomyxa filosa TaxID=46433 RepID=X6N646_RETFI|nr:hypothetical protein RFI_15716 [Reticulomyxa filosa]|eukprot:ETO21491.1 hypothetical protein RFI_15716 [Reticulomyxa filosa]
MGFVHCYFVLHKMNQERIDLRDTENVLRRTMVEIDKNTVAYKNTQILIKMPAVELFHLIYGNLDAVTAFYKHLNVEFAMENGIEADRNKKTTLFFFFFFGCCMYVRCFFFLGGGIMLAFIELIQLYTWCRQHFAYVWEEEEEKKEENEKKVEKNNELNMYVNVSLIKTIWNNKIGYIQLSHKIPQSTINSIHFMDANYAKYYRAIRHSFSLKKEDQWVQVLKMKYVLLFYKFLQRGEAEYELNVSHNLFEQARQVLQMTQKLTNLQHNNSIFVHETILVLTRILSELFDLLDDSLMRFRKTEFFQTQLHAIIPPL